MEVKKEISDKDMKKRLIELIEELNKGQFLSTLTEKDLGSSNIITMVNAAQNGDCYEEFKLYVGYKKAKGQGKGWATCMKDGKILADHVIEHIEEIYNSCNRNDEVALKWIGQYFGYLYWKKVAVGVSNHDDKKTTNQHKPYSNRTGVK